jgi:hypothetical protein
VIGIAFVVQPACEMRADLRFKVVFLMQRHGFKPDLIRLGPIKACFNPRQKRSSILA